MKEKEILEMQRLIDEGQQEGHDDHKYRAIYNNVRVAICI